jgi:hypothetical protein
MFSELLRNQRAEASGAPASLVPRHDGDTRGSRRRQWIEHEAAAMASSRLPSEGPQDTKPYRRLRGPPRTSPQPTQTHRWNVDDARRAAGDGRECRRCPSVEPGSLHRRRHGNRDRVPYIAGKWHESYERTVVHAAIRRFV